MSEINMNEFSYSALNACHKLIFDVAGRLQKAYSRQNVDWTRISVSDDCAYDHTVYIEQSSLH